LASVNEDKPRKFVITDYKDGGEAAGWNGGTVERNEPVIPKERSD
jgi:hypothetical protein